jgi:hypothetical protein
VGKVDGFVHFPNRCTRTSQSTETIHLHRLIHHASITQLTQYYLTPSNTQQDTGLFPSWPPLSPWKQDKLICTVGKDRWLVSPNAPSPLPTVSLECDIGKLASLPSQGHMESRECSLSPFSVEHPTLRA